MIITLIICDFTLSSIRTLGHRYAFTENKKNKDEKEIPHTWETGVSTLNSNEHRIAPSNTEQHRLTPCSTEYLQDVIEDQVRLRQVRNYSVLHGIKTRSYLMVGILPIFGSQLLFGAIQNYSLLFGVDTHEHFFFTGKCPDQYNVYSICIHYLFILLSSLIFTSHMPSLSKKAANKTGQPSCSVRERVGPS